eukprot:g2057.t1
MFCFCRRSSKRKSGSTSENFFPPGQPSPSPKDIANAEAIKNEGNRLFAKGKYLAAAEKYTEAIALHPKWIVTLVNRANCYRRLNRWTEVQRDCHTALKIDNETMKAHYFLGLALEEQNDHALALRHLQKSYELARDKEDQIMEEIWQKIARVSYSQWQHNVQQWALQDSRLRSKLIEILKEHHQHEKQTSKEQKNELAALDSLFDRASDRMDEIPSCFVCPQTKNVFRNPVISSEGLSYEQSALKSQPRNSPGVHSGTHQYNEGSNFIRNLNLRSATHCYLEKHPWAWKGSI